MAKFKAPAPPYLGPVAHSSGTGNKPINRIVIHCTVSKCAVGARDIAAYFKKKVAGGSAHYITSATETIQSAYDSVVCWHAPPNSHSLGVEMCCTLANQGKGHWDRADHIAMMKRTAALVAQLCLAYDVPIKKLSPADLRAGKKGICGHVDVSQAFKQSSHWDPGPHFPWDKFMAMVRQEAARLAPAAAASAAKPTKKPKPKPAPDPAILSAFAYKTPSDHLTVRARIKAGKAEFVAVTANIRATPPMRAVNVQRCVDLALGHDVSVVGFNEMGGRDLLALLSPHAGWAPIQGPRGDQGRAPIAYDMKVWQVIDSEVVQFSSAAVKTKLGPIHVPSGNRYATVARLTHRDTGTKVAFISYHAIAHMNVGAHFGWTGRGPKALLALRSKIPNPAITVYKQGMAELEAKILELRAAGYYVVPMGDWNVDFLAEAKATKREQFGPTETMRRAGVTTIYSAKKWRKGTAGKRGIDVLGVAGPK